MLLFFFFNDSAPTEIYTLSLHDALPISRSRSAPPARVRRASRPRRPTRSRPRGRGSDGDRKGTRLNSSHVAISYAVFCLKKKKNRVLRIDEELDKKIDTVRFLISTFDTI